MTPEPDVATARRRAQELVEGGEVSGVGLRTRGQLGDPIRIVTPAGALHGWFVPLTMADVLTGFLELTPDLEVRRASTFQRREDSLAGCPSAASWLVPDTIRQRAEAKLRPSEKALAPQLSYDRTPARIAWAVPVISASGHERTVFVAGDVVWEEVRNGTDGMIE